MGRLLLLTIACAGLVLAANSGDGKPDFSGNWVLNLDKSNFGKSHKPEGMTLTVTRNGDSMHAIQTTNTQSGPTDPVEGDWILDGRQHGNVTTRWEGNTLVSERHDGSMHQRIYLTMSPDGKTATEKVMTTSPDGTNTSRLVWERK
jgi:hypothetical protein